MAAMVILHKTGQEGERTTEYTALKQLKTYEVYKRGICAKQSTLNRRLNLR